MTIRTAPASPSQAKPVEKDAGKGGKQSEEEDGNFLERLEKERVEKAKAEEKAAEEQARKDKNCNIAKKNLTGLKIGGRRVGYHLPDLIEWLESRTLKVPSRSTDK